MISWILLIIVLAALIVLLTLAFATAFGRGEQTPELPETAELNEENIEALAAGNLDDVRFDVSVRGYNQAQVDAVVEYLFAELRRARAGADREQ
ncbi:DivIVA domain-containing protein [Corynebacterium vitaeruminis]|jgi:DivIVA domain-containing protein|uniref:DivIVA domain-containing protein n=1 Tax=Corynebacterium vitaeruminis DSM 20294 TaxID=1224164 RepID=W5Y7J1_9CORY|nr:DivIVA domain-containing protein [Corynebacterium vitaeruminis]AHI22453.1 hypothetical protein B843_05340 [Corynebacterium vitaeruminis DSM 20294]